MRHAIQTFIDPLLAFKSMCILILFMRFEAINLTSVYLLVHLDLYDVEKEMYDIYITWKMWSMLISSRITFVEHLQIGLQI